MRDSDALADALFSYNDLTKGPSKSYTVVLCNTPRDKITHRGGLGEAHWVYIYIYIYILRIS